MKMGKKKRNRKIGAPQKKKVPKSENGEKFDELKES